MEVLLLLFEYADLHGQTPVMKANSLSGQVRNKKSNPPYNESSGLRAS